MQIAIIGAGAAGCFAAANIPAQAGREVTVYEKTSKVMQKVKASGGGRCNVTHDCPDVPELVTCYPRGKALLRKSLYHFTPADTVQWFAERGVVLKTEPDGRMFPVTDDSQTIIDCIWQEMMRQGASVQYHKAIMKVLKLATGFELHFADGIVRHADKLLVTVGSYSKPEGYQWLQELGHSIEAPVPSLFTFNMPKHPITALMGVSVPEVTIKIAGTKITESGPLLITHWGMSGPVVLRTSAWAARELHERNYEFDVVVNWLNDATEQDVKETIQALRQDNGKQTIYHKNPWGLPKRLWEYLMQECAITDAVRWGELPAALQNNLIQHLIRDTYAVKGKTTFKEEFVTCGGVSLKEMDSQTMQSRLVPGLYFAGEVMDVDGITGGYNFQHAWSSAVIAARHMSTNDNLT
jgi:predicted Rossmann fold flavoprotein